MAGAYTALGVPGGVAVTGVVGYRVVAFWLPVLVGLATHLRLVLHDDDGVRPAVEAADDSSSRGP
jgi:uncharacterized membrane protein YbhN (UPF0104 family)